MKVTYNWLKDFVQIKLSAKTLADKLTMAGLEVTSLEERDGDFVFEIEVTSNRPDSLSIMGIAREVVAITGKKLSRYPVIPLSRSNRQTGKWFDKLTIPRTIPSEVEGPANRLTIAIEDKKDCPLYTARIIRNVQVGPSPDWLKKRLELVGCRSVNNVVDITNYIMFAWGEPLHAFDLDKMVNQLASAPVSQLNINVRRAKRGEEIITIDGEKKILDEKILVIASAVTGKPIALAGIMGGKDTEVTEGTKNILLEAAVFNPLIVRRARRNLGLESESAYRFERGIDLEIVKIASWQAAGLIRKITGGECVLSRDSGLTKVKKRRLNLNVATLPKILGVSITAPKIKTILNNLGFKVMSKVRHKDWRKYNLNLEVPSYRQDVNGKIDLIEEIARIYGYEYIPRTLPKVSPQIAISTTRDTVSLIKNILVGLGLNEVVTYSLINQDLLKDLSCPFYEAVYDLGKKERDLEIPAAIEILNPLTEEQEILRPTVIPQLLKCLALNLNQKQSHIELFEIANVFLVNSGKPQEKLVLSIAFEQDLGKQERGFLHLKGILEVIFERLDIRDYNFKLIVNSSEVAVDLAGEKIGVITGIQKNILERFDIKNKAVFAAELFLDKLISDANLKKRFSALPVYPGISRDISFILKEDIRAGDILEAIRERGRPLLRDLKLVDYYRGKQIPAGFKGLTISCLYRLDERTLTEAEINPLHSQILTLLVDKFNVKIRS